MQVLDRLGAVVVVARDGGAHLRGELEATAFRGRSRRAGYGATTVRIHGAAHDAGRVSLWWVCLCWKRWWWFGCWFDVQLQPSALHYSLRYSGSNAIASRLASSGLRSHRDGTVLLHLSLSRFGPAWQTQRSAGSPLLLLTIHASVSITHRRKSQEIAGEHSRQACARYRAAAHHVLRAQGADPVARPAVLCALRLHLAPGQPHAAAAHQVGAAGSFCNPLQLHPTWSLPFFVVFLACLNALLALAHLWAPASATNRGDAILIDFVGQDAAPGRLHMLGIDLCVAAVQLLMTVVAFECAKDQAKQDGEQSLLDDTTERQGEERGQGWDVRDEEAALFGLDTDDEARRERTSLTHCIAVVRLRPIVDDIVNRQFLPDAPPAEAQQEPQAQQPTVQTGDRPDTSRIRRFSRVHAQRQHLPTPVRRQRMRGWGLYPPTTRGHPCG